MDERPSTCVICLDYILDVTTRGNLTVCNHVFHFNCIKKWSKVTNLCPACKSSFNEITVKATDGKVIQREEIDAVTQKSANDDLPSTSINYCMACGGEEERTSSSETLVTCAGCNTMSFHARCIPGYHTPPWYCETCVTSSRQRRCHTSASSATSEISDMQRDLQLAKGRSLQVLAAQKTRKRKRPDGSSRRTVATKSQLTVVNNDDKQQQQQNSSLLNEQEALEIFTRMERARVADLSSTSLPGTAKLSLLPTVLSLFNSTSTQKTRLIQLGGLHALITWLPPNTDLYHYPQVTAGVLSILLNLSLTAEQLLQHNGLGKIVLSLCNNDKSLSFRADTITRLAQGLITQWSGIVSAAAENSKRDIVVQRSSTSNDQIKSVVKEYVKSVLMPQYQQKRISKQEFINVARYVSQTFISQSSSYTSRPVLATSGTSHQLSSWAKKRITDLISKNS